MTEILILIMTNCLQPIHKVSSWGLMRLTIQTSISARFLVNHQQQVQLPAMKAEIY